MSTDVVERPEMNRFELAVGGNLAIAEYGPEDGRLSLTHTEVPESLEGQGVGSRLAQGVFEILRDTGRRAVLLCPFLKRYAEKHPEFRSVAEGQEQPTGAGR